MGSQNVNKVSAETPIWVKYADQFPVRDNLIYLNHAAVAPLPRRTADAIRHLSQVRNLLSEPLAGLV